MYRKWAFNVNRGEEILQKWNCIPENVDILITHGPPVGEFYTRNTTFFFVVLFRTLNFYIVLTINTTIIIKTKEKTKTHKTKRHLHQRYK